MEAANVCVCLSHLWRASVVAWIVSVEGGGVCDSGGVCNSTVVCDNGGVCNSGEVKRHTRLQSTFFLTWYDILSCGIHHLGISRNVF